MRTSAGNVLIGTTTDTGAKFHINSDFTQNDIIFTGASGGTQNAYINFNQAGNNSLTIGTGYNSDSNKIEFAPKGSVSMTLLGSGNVGIGTTSPSAKLDIVSISATGIEVNTTGGYFAATFTTDYDNVARFLSSDSDSSIVIQDSNSTNNGNKIGVVTDDMYFTTAGAEKMRITSAGKVGIGTASPSQGLHVVDGGILVSQFESSNNTTSQIQVTNSSGNDAYFGISGSRLVLNNNNYGADHFSMDSSGNVGIGTSSPEEKLHVVGDTFIDGGLKVNAANIDFTGLGTSDPGVTGRLWSDRGVLKISAG